MILETERLILRPWDESDAESLFEYAKDERVGPAAGWPPHTSVENSRKVIGTVLSAPETYAICLKEDNRAIGSVGLKLNGYTDMTDRDDECELGYWLGVPFWGRGIMPEAAGELIRRAFADLGMRTVWCGYYDGNEKSRRVQEKLGFVHHHSCADVPVPLLNETRIGHTNILTKEEWGKKMNVNYEHKNELTFIGFHTEIAPDEGYQKCPEFWDREYAEKYARLWQTMKPETAVEAAILENGIGMYAVCADGDDGFAYWIAGLYIGGDVPEGLELFTFPESDWAVFTAKGPIPGSLQTLNTQVWNEWAPNIKTMYEIGSSSIEIYSAGNPQSPDYECGIWVPIRKKTDLKICQSCGMPMEADDVFGTDTDGSINEDYCKYCYTNGEFIDKVPMEEYIEMCSQFGAQAGMTNKEMKAYCEKLFPTLKRWKR